MGEDINMMATSVIVPTYNRAEMLRECLEAIFAQTLPPAEIIVVDDGSTDHTAKIVQHCGNSVIYLRQQNAGKSAALNLALRSVRFPLIWIVDDDDLVCPDALARLTGLLSRTPAADFSYGRHISFVESSDTGDRSILPTGYWRKCRPEDFFVSTLEDFFAHQGGKIVRKRLYDQVGPFDETLLRSQDYDMLVRLARVGSGIGTEEVVFQQRVHGGLRGPAFDRHSPHERVHAWQKYDGRLFRRLYSELELYEYLPKDQKLTTDRDRRRAFLQRGCIMGRKMLWDLALADYTSAAGIDAGNLDTNEIAILKRAMFSKYAYGSAIIDDSAINEIASLHYRSAAGAEIAANLARGLVWHIRQAAREFNITRAAQLASRFARMRYGASLAR